MKWNEFGMQAYLRPLFRKLTFRQARKYMVNCAQEFQRIIFRGSRKQTQQPPQARVYQPPQLTKLTPEQAKLKLLGYLSMGDEGAKDLLDLLFAAQGAPSSQGQPQEESANSLRRTG